MSIFPTNFVSMWVGDSSLRLEIMFSIRSEAVLIKHVKLISKSSW